MKLLWYSNAPWVATGYGAQTAQVVSRLAADGVEVAVAANYGLQGRRTNWGGVRVYPQGWDPSGWSNDVLPAHANDWFGRQPGWVVTLCDVWVLRNPALAQFRTAAWVPVDHMPVPPAVRRFFDMGALPVAMSQFGAAQLARSGLDPRYVPHAIDTAVFRPGATYGGRSGRQLLGIPEDRFLVGMVANNKGRHPARKGFDVAFQAFAALRASFPDAALYVHADRNGTVHDVDLAALAERCRIPEDSVFFPEGYALRSGLPDDLMAAFYGAFDVLLAPSMGEGFGIPVIEAQACGCPVIVSEFSAQPELVGAGWTVQGQLSNDEDQQAWLFQPFVEDVAMRLVEAREARGDRLLRDRAASWAQAFDADAVYAARWRPLLDHMAQAATPPVLDLCGGGAVDLGLVAA